MEWERIAVTTSCDVYSHDKEYDPMTDTVRTCIKNHEIGRGLMSGLYVTGRTLVVDASLPEPPKESKQ